MSLPAIIILLLYGILGVLFFMVLVYVKRQGRELFGRPAMNVYTQITGKFALFIPALILPAAALGADLSWIETGLWMKWISVAVCFAAMVFLNYSLLQMGKYTKMGLPDKDEIELQTRGIYAVSRNPMYFGLFLLAVSSVIYVPNPVNLLAAITGIVVHHRIILSEERFLAEQFKNRWQSYKTKVRRYI